MNNIVILEQTLLPDAWKTLLLKGIVLLVLGIFCLYPLLHFSQDLLRLVNQKQRGGWYCLVS